MKILLTGHPKIGKSTILENFKKEYYGSITGIIAHSLEAEDGTRLGFEADNLQGERKIFAHKTLIKSNFVVGNKYFVDVEVIDKFFVPELRKGMKDLHKLILIDEIGRMEAFSKIFLQTVRGVFNSDATVLGTIVYDPETWSLEYKNHPGVVIVTVNEQNRDVLQNLLLDIFSNKDKYIQLNKQQKLRINIMLREYFNKNAFIQIKKLFNNAIPYVIDDKIIRSGNIYTVKGNIRVHTVNLRNDGMNCDCDFFKGKGDYLGLPGECSHIQAVKLFSEITM